MAFCILCGKQIQPKIAERQAEYSVRGTKFEYKELVAYCPHCCSEVYTPETNDANVDRRFSAFEAALIRRTTDGEA